MQFRRTFMMLGCRVVRADYSTSAQKFVNGNKLNSKIPPKSEWKEIDRKSLPKRGVVDDATVELLERLSLVDFNNQAGVETLMDAISLADTLQEVDTTGVEPMDSVLDDRALRLREDVVTQGNCKDDIMKNAAKTFEDYFVAPPGNIPLRTKPASRYLDPQKSEGTGKKR